MLKILKNSPLMITCVSSMTTRTRPMEKHQSINKMIGAECVKIIRESTYSTYVFQLSNKSKLLLTLLVGLAYSRWICQILINIQWNHVSSGGGTRITRFIYRQLKQASILTISLSLQVRTQQELLYKLYAFCIYHYYLVLNTLFQVLLLARGLCCLNITTQHTEMHPPLSVTTFPRHRLISTILAL